MNARGFVTAKPGPQKSKAASVKVKSAPKIAAPHTGDGGKTE